MRPASAAADGAGPSTRHPFRPRPYNEPWDNVNHINGRLVKVGEKGATYLLKYKKTNIATNPIGWMFGFYGLSVSHAVCRTTRRDPRRREHLRDPE